MTESSTPHLSSFGATPRIFPRPSYPPIRVALFHEIKSLIWSSGALGTMLVFAVQPLYVFFVQYLHDKGYSEAYIFSAVLNCMHTAVWFLVNVPLLLCDNFGYFQQYKLFRAPGQKPSFTLIRENIATALLMQATINPILAYYLHDHWVSLGMQPLAATLPRWQDVFASMLCGYVFNTVMFYLTHRMFHTKALYFLHKQHHQFAGTIAPAAEHANPVEVVIANIIPTFYGVLLFGCKHPLVIISWFGMRLQETYLSHSGYCFLNTWFDWIGLAHAEQAIFHDHHHTSNRGNFGSMLLDQIFGTMDHFVAIGCHAGYLQRGQDQRELKKAPEDEVHTTAPEPQQSLNSSPRTRRSTKKLTKD